MRRSRLPGLLAIGILALAAFISANRQPSTSTVEQIPSTRVPPTATAILPPATPLPSIGNTGTVGEWTVRFDAAETAPRIGSQAALGKFVIVTLTITNTRTSESQLNGWDFKLTSDAGLTYSTDGDGQVALSGNPRPVILAEPFPPRLPKPVRQVFDVAPDATVFTLDAAGVRFKLTLS